MTDVSSGKRTLPLLGSPGRSRTWLFVLAFGIPATVIVIAFSFALARNAPTLPMLLAGAFALGVTGLVTLWILRMIGRVAVTLGGDSLIVNTGIVTRSFPLSTLRAGGLRSVSLAEHVELKPVLRTWGIGMPGLASGWFRLRNGGKALCILTGRERVTVLRSDDGTWILLSLADPAPLRAGLAG